MVAEIPEGFKSDFVRANGIKFHVVHNLPDNIPVHNDKPIIIMLHGFPEFWFAWEAVMRNLVDDYYIIVPDQRGYNLSDAPSGMESYKTRFLVDDIISLADIMLGEEQFILAGHDWGASVAYATSMRSPQRVSHLLIANGAHPVCFQNAIMDHPAQAAASNYFHFLRRKDAAELLVENDFRRLFGMLETLSQTDWLTNEHKELYRTAWRDAQRTQAMVDWYNASPIIVPKNEEPTIKPSLYRAPPDKFKITMPHTLVWGEKDKALLSSCHENLHEYCDCLKKVILPDADHWLLHTHASEITKVIRDIKI